MPRRPLPPQTLSITGIVLVDDADFKEQVPIPNTKITVTTNNRSFQTTSDPSGLFHFSLTLRAQPPQVTSLAFEAAGYRPLAISRVLDGRILVTRLLPESRASTRETSQEVTTIAGVSVRYTTKTTSAVNVGALVKTFEAVNNGGIPCSTNPVCSPDGKWKATVSSAIFEAGSGNQFVDARVSCIAGPCPFTRIEANNLSDPGRAIRVSVRNWSDTATFLVEAEVSRIINGSMVRQSIPAIFGPALSFTLPTGAEGPSIEAEVNGTRIVFPLGPEHQLSWADCNSPAAQNGTQVFQCELKPGYQFR